MKNAILLVSAALMLSGCQAGPEPAVEAEPFEGETYGETVTLTTLTHIAVILDRPDDFVGERVLVEGRVVDVCANMGCWMDLVGDDDTQRIQVKVDDGVIVFPQEARGHRARVEGVVEKVERTEEEALAAARHAAEERGVEFDPSTVQGPETVYRVRALGALIAR